MSQLKQAYVALVAHARECSQATSSEVDPAIVERLISLAAQFATAVYGSGGEEVLNLRAGFIENDTSRPSEYWHSRNEALAELTRRGVQRDDNWGSLFTREEFRGSVFRSLLEFPEVTSQLLNESEQLYRTMRDPSGAPLPVMSEWRDVVRSTVDFAQQQSHWGYYLLRQCMSLIGKGTAHEYLCFALRRSFPDVVKAVEHAANGLYTSVADPIEIMAGPFITLLKAINPQHFKSGTSSASPGTNEENLSVHGPGSSGENWTISENFTSMIWGKVTFKFKGPQIACMKAIWPQKERFLVADVLEKADELTQDNSRGRKGIGLRRKFSDIFRDHAAWGTMIVRFEGEQSIYKLVEPPVDE